MTSIHIIINIYNAFIYSALCNIQRKSLPVFLRHKTFYLQNRKLGKYFRCGKSFQLNYVVYMLGLLVHNRNNFQLAFRKSRKLFLQINIFPLFVVVNPFSVSLDPQLCEAFAGFGGNRSGFFLSVSFVISHLCLLLVVYDRGFLLVKLCQLIRKLLDKICQPFVTSSAPSQSARSSRSSSARQERQNPLVPAQAQERLL